MLVNDFGELPIDADLIENREGDTLAIAGGCVCCSFGSDLVAALKQIAARDPAPDHLLIESSGVALPGAIAATVSLVPGFANDGIVVLADAETVRTQAADRYIGDTIERQLRDAGLILLTKSDLVSPAERAETRAWLQRFAPAVDVERGDIPLELLLGPGVGKTRDAFAPAPSHPDYETLAIENLPALDVDNLVSVLTDPANGVLRAKGFVRDHADATHILQVVGARGGATDGTSVAKGSLVCLGLRGTLRADAIRSAVSRN